MYNELLKEKIHILEEEKRQMSGLLKRFGQQADRLKELVETDRILTLSCSHYFIQTPLETAVVSQLRGIRSDITSDVILTCSTCRKCGYVRIIKTEL